MNGFGKDFEEKTYSGKLYHACTLEGWANLIQNFREDDYMNGHQSGICFSTEDCKRHDVLGREVIIVLNIEDKEGLYTPFDADGGQDWGWDEFRTMFTEKEFWNCLKEIQIEDWAYDHIMRAEKEEFENDDDACWQYNNLYENYGSYLVDIK